MHKFVLWTLTDRGIGIQNAPAPSRGQFDTNVVFTAAHIYLFNTCEPTSKTSASHLFLFTHLRPLSLYYIYIYFQDLSFMSIIKNCSINDLGSVVSRCHASGFPHDGSAGTAKTILPTNINCVNTFTSFIIRHQNIEESPWNAVLALELRRFRAQTVFSLSKEGRSEHSVWSLSCLTATGSRHEVPVVFFFWHMN